MLRLPIYGFAKRVDDTVDRAMTILHSRDDYTAKRHPSVAAPKPKTRNTDERQQ